MQGAALVFFSEKEIAQLKDIRNVSELEPSLRLWHIKRAIEREMVELKKSSQSRICDSLEAKCFWIVYTHYFRSSIFLNATREDLCLVGLTELRYFCEGVERNFLNTSTYEYCSEKFQNLWGIRAGWRISLIHTTVKVETNCSVLKEPFFLQFNRSLVDLHVHIIASQLMPKAPEQL